MSNNNDKVMTVKEATREGIAIGTVIGFDAEKAVKSAAKKQAKLITDATMIAIGAAPPTARFPTVEAADMWLHFVCVEHFGTPVAEVAE